MSSFEGKFVKNTYQGVIHSDGELGNTPKLLYDGKGNESSIAVGKADKGVNITGNLKVGTLTYPKTGSTAGKIAYLVDSTTLGFTDEIPLSFLPEIVPSPAGTYSGIKTIKVNSAGLVTDVEEFSQASGVTTVTSTSYFSTASVYSTVIIPSGWTLVSLNNIPTTAKTAIMYLEPDEGNFDPANRKYNKISVSPNASNSYPVLYTAGGEDAGGGADKYGSGSQFTSRVSVVNGKIAVYFKDEGTATGKSWDLYVLGYQE